MADPVAFRGARRGRRHRAGHAPGDRLMDRPGQLLRTGHPLVGEHRGETARIALADRADLPGALAAVELQGGDRGLAVETGEGEGGDLGAFEARDSDEGCGDRTEADRATDAHGQRQQHGDAVHRGGQGVEVHGEPVLGGGLLGHFESGQLGRARVGDPLDAVHRALLVAERGTGHDGRTGRYPDLQTGLGQGVVLPPDQLGRHCPVPSTS